MVRLRHAGSGAFAGLDVGGAQKRLLAREEAALKETKLQGLRGARDQLERELIDSMAVMTEAPRPLGPRLLHYPHGRRPDAWPNMQSLRT